ncbi:uncharacterized protein LOC142222757 [Haematobia irritans]
MENIAKMASTLPDFEDDVPMSDEEREIDPTIAPLADVSTISTTADPATLADLSTNKNPLTTAPGVPPGELSVASPPLSAPVRKNQGSNIQRGRRECVICKAKHHLRDCKEFRAMRIERRLRTVALHKCCGNCLDATHFVRDCPSLHRCKHCNGDHHTMLHNHAKNSADRSRPATKSAPRQKSGVPPKPGRSSIRPHITSDPSVRSYQPSTSSAPRPVMAIQPVATLGPTMVIQLELNDRRVPVRALLDPCAGLSLICRSLAEELRLSPVAVGPEVFCQVSVASSHDPSQRLGVSARIVDLTHITSPSESVNPALKDHFAGLQLADPHFYQASHVAIVLGPEVYHKIMRPQTYSSPGFPWAQLTMFGWVISGPCNI